MPTKPSDSAAACALLYMPVRKACGVCAFQNTFLSGVPIIMPSSTTLSVSMAGCATTAPSQSKLPRTVLITCMMVSELINGRAPSCTTTNSYLSGTCSSPLKALSWRTAPAAAHVIGVTKSKGSTAARLYSTWRSFGATITMCPTSSTQSNASIAHVRIGRPAICTSCLPPFTPKRSPEPPAIIMAAAAGLFPTRPNFLPTGRTKRSASSSRSLGISADNSIICFICAPRFLN